MLKKERQNSILEIIKERKYCTVALLSNKLYVAPITIRRDLAQLEQKGLITRCFGGATILDYENREIPFEIRNKSNFSIKDSIAKKAIKFISTGDVIFLDASSTVSHIIDFLSPEQNLTIITNSTLLTERLKEKHIKCYLTGGSPVENSHALIGSIAEHTIRNFHANLSFFSSQGIDKNGIISDYSEAETALRKIMIENSEKQFFLFDNSKLGKRYAFKLCTVSDITDFITNEEISFK